MKIAVGGMQHETNTFAPTRADLITYSRALDRILQWRQYVVPSWHLGAFRIAYWDKLRAKRQAGQDGE